MRRAFLEDAAVVHHRDALDDAQRHVHVVLDDDVADMGGQRGEDRDQIAALGRRQARRRFVEQDEARRAGERQRDFELPLLAVRQFADQTVGHRFEMHERDQIGDRLHDRVAARGADEGETAARDAAAGEIDVLAHGQPREQAAKSGRCGAARGGCARAAADGHVLAEEAHGAGRRRKIAGHAIEQRRLAGAVRSEHGAALAGTDVQRDVGQRRERAEDAADAAQFDGVAGAGGGHSFGDRAQRRVLPPEARPRVDNRRQMPITPSGENKTMSRKQRPISV